MICLSPLKFTYKLLKLKFERRCLPIESIKSFMQLQLSLQNYFIIVST